MRINPAIITAVLFATLPAGAVDCDPNGPVRVFINQAEWEAALRAEGATILREDPNSPDRFALDRDPAVLPFRRFNQVLSNPPGADTQSLVYRPTIYGAQLKAFGTKWAIGDESGQGKRTIEIIFESRDGYELVPGPAEQPVHLPAIVRIDTARILISQLTHVLLDFHDGAGPFRETSVCDLGNLHLLGSVFPSDPDRTSPFLRNNKGQFIGVITDKPFKTVRIWNTDRSSYVIGAYVKYGEIAYAEAPSPPMLDIRRTGNDMVVSWPLDAGEGTLQFTTNLVGGAWLDASGARGEAGNAFTQAVETAGSQGFFRLVE